MICVSIFMGKLFHLRSKDFFDRDSLGGLERINTVIPHGNRRQDMYSKFLTQKNNYPTAIFFFSAAGQSVIVLKKNEPITTL